METIDFIWKQFENWFVCMCEWFAYILLQLEFNSIELRNTGVKK